MATPLSIADQGFKLPVTLTNPTAATVFTDAGGSAITCNVSPNQSPVADLGLSQKVFQNKIIDIKAAGKVTGGTTTNFTPVIQLGNSATAGSNTNLIAPAAAAVNSVSATWMLEGELFWDVTSAKIWGVYWGWINATAVTQAVVTATALTAANFFTTGMYFSVSALFSVSNAGNNCSLDQFDVDPV